MVRPRNAEDGTCLAIFTEHVTSRETCIVFSPGAELSVTSMVPLPLRPVDLDVYLSSAQEDKRREDATIVVLRGLCLDLRCCGGDGVLLAVDIGSTMHRLELARSVQAEHPTRARADCPRAESCA